MILLSATLLIGPVTAASVVDTVLVPKALLDRVLSNPQACRPVGPSPWPVPASVGQTGRAAVLSGNRVALMDLEAKVMRVFGADGRELARLGGHGEGPGEFGSAAQIFAWSGDTIAVHDFRTARLSFFTEKAFATSVGLGAVPGLATGGLMGRMADGALVFGTGLDLENQPEHSGIFRGKITLVRWRIGEPETRPVQSGIDGPQWYSIQFGDRRGIMAANFGRSTSFGVVGNRVVAYDNAAPAVQLIDASGRTDRVVRLEVRDPPVSREDRDSLLASLRVRGGNRTPPPRVLEVMSRFPEARPAALWKGADHEGFWLAFPPPVAAGGIAYIRFTAAGVPDRCYRAPADTRLLAVGSDRAVISTENPEGDLITVQLTTRYPAR